MKKALALLALTLSLVGCTANIRAKNWGGTMTLTLPKGEKLVTVTWKDAHLWYLTRRMRSDDSVETYTFREDSNFGVMNGTVVLQEVR